MQEIMKKRTIKVDGITCGGCEKTINDALSTLEGIKEVKVDKSGVVVKYDLKKITLESVLNKIRNLNYRPSTGFFEKLKTGFMIFTEQNELDNMHSVSRSCCNIPE